MTTIMNLVAALTWNQGPEPKMMSYQPDRLRIEGVEYIMPAPGGRQPVRLRITGLKSDACLQIGEPAFDFDTEKNRVVVALHAFPGSDKPCNGRTARFRTVMPLIGLAGGSYEVKVNDFVANEPLKVRYGN